MRPSPPDPKQRRSFVTIMPNSVEGRDIAYQMHPNVNLRAYEKTGGLVIESGDGIYVTDNNGKRYIEAMAGLWSVALGFGEKRLAAVAKAQMEKLPYYHTFGFRTHGPSIDLAEMLIKIAPVPMSKVHFTSSGSEANDLAAKMVWYRSNALGQRDKKKIIGRLKGYHGVTIAAASITGLPRNHESFDLPLDRMIHTSCPSYVHFAKAGESETEFTARMLQDLESLILKEGPETIAAFWGEPVMGAGGVLMPPAGYWEGVQAILNKYDILLVADEVICGFGRTGKMFACETFNIRPDVLVVSKQITSSYMPLSAILMNDRFYQPIADESDRIGSFGHGYTASGHPVATAVGLENLKIIQERGLVGHVADLQDTFLSGLAELVKHPVVHSSRGIGLIGALEIKPWTDAKPGDAALAVADAALEAGVITRNIGEAVCFCPPLIITAVQINDMFESMGQALDKVAKRRV
jgi:4-aminobutyrate--pyruvate transaminase